VVTTVTVREKDRTLEEAGGIVMTVRSWTTDDVTGMQEITDFQRRYAEALGEIFGFDSAATIAPVSRVRPSSRPRVSCSTSTTLQTRAWL
jgi:hypothetical protein